MATSATATDRDGPGKLTGRSWKHTLKRTLKGFKRDNLTDWAAAPTYYGILAVFPALLALVSILGVIGSSVTQPLPENIASSAPAGVIGVSDSFLTVWDIAKWPVLLVVVSLMLSVLYLGAPNVKHPAFAGSRPAASSRS